MKNLVVSSILFATLMFQSLHSEEINVIHSNSLYYPELTVRDIQDIYTFDIIWDELGNPITLVHMNKYSYEYDWFIEHFLYTSLRSYNNLLESRRAKGTVFYIRYADTPYEVIDIVRNTPSSIGYVGSNIYINPGAKNEIKIINISSINF